MANETLSVATESRDPVIVDLGKHDKKKIKRLRKGKGRLMDDVSDVLRELREAGVVDANAQPVIVVVREKAEDRWMR